MTCSYEDTETLFCLPGCSVEERESRLAFIRFYELQVAASTRATGTKLCRRQTRLLHTVSRLRCTMYDDITCRFFSRKNSTRGALPRSLFVSLRAIAWQENFKEKKTKRVVGRARSSRLLAERIGDLLVGLYNVPSDVERESILRKYIEIYFQAR